MVKIKRKNGYQFVIPSSDETKQLEVFRREIEDFCQRNNCIVGEFDSHLLYK